MSYTPLEESQCDNPCQNNWANGACGHYTVNGSRNDYANLYSKVCNHDGLCYFCSALMRNSSAETSS